MTQSNHVLISVTIGWGTLCQCRTLRWLMHFYSLGTLIFVNLWVRDSYVLHYARCTLLTGWLSSTWPVASVLLTQSTPIVRLVLKAPRSTKVYLLFVVRSSSLVLVSSLCVRLQSLRVNTSQQASNCCDLGSRDCSSSIFEGLVLGVDCRP